MVAACRCLSPATFGHDWYCERELGPPGPVPTWANRSQFRPMDYPPMVLPAIPEFPRPVQNETAEQRRKRLRRGLEIIRMRRALY